MPMDMRRERDRVTKKRLKKNMVVQHSPIQQQRSSAKTKGDCADLHFDCASVQWQLVDVLKGRVGVSYIRETS